MKTAPDHSLRGLLRERRGVPLVMALVGVLALGNALTTPEQGRRWLVAGLLLPVLWLGLALWYRWVLAGVRQRGTGDPSDVRRYFLSAATLFVFALGVRQTVILGLDLWSGLGGPPLPPDVERRVIGGLYGVVLIGVGNALPKILTPLALLPRRHAERVTVARRFVGTTLVVLGLAVALASLTAQVAFAVRVLRLAGLAVVLSTLGAIVWMNVAPWRQVE